MLLCVETLVSNEYLFIALSPDDILLREDGPLCAEIGSELQKQFAILPGWFDFFFLLLFLLYSRT